MNENYPFVRNDVLPSFWANAIQKFMSVYVDGLFLSTSNNTTLTIPAGTGIYGPVAIAIQGRWRFIEATLSFAHPGGAAATYDVFVTAHDNHIVSTPAPFTDLTDYSFSGVVVAHNATPGGVDLYRKIGEVVWDGTKITRVDQFVGSVSGAAVDRASLQSTDLTITKDRSGAYTFAYAVAPQPLDATLTALAGATTAADKLPYFSGVDVVSLATFSAFARTLIDDADASTAQSTLGISTFIKTLIDDIDAPTARTTLGVGSDAAAGTASMRTLGTGAAQAAAGNDSRLSDARTPTAHAASHGPGAADTIWGTIADATVPAVTVSGGPLIAGTAGVGGAASGAGAGGSGGLVRLTAGVGGAAAAGAGVGGFGGTVSLIGGVGGAATSTGVGGAGGGGLLAAGAGGAGAAARAGGAGGSMSVSAGAGGADGGSGGGAGGAITVAGGAAAGAAGGNVNINAGSVSSGNGNGGSVFINAGNKSGSGTSGQVSISGSSVIISGVSSASLDATTAVTVAASATSTYIGNNSGSIFIGQGGAGLGFFSAVSAAVKQTVTGSRGGNAALASLLTALASYGLLTNSSTA